MRGKMTTIKPVIDEEWRKEYEKVNPLSRIFPFVDYLTIATNFKKEGAKTILTIWDDWIQMAIIDFERKYPQYKGIEGDDVVAELKKELELGNYPLSTRRSVV